MAFTNFQRGGLLDPQGKAGRLTRTHATLISEAAGAPGVRMQLTPGVAQHRHGLAVDFQAGRGNDVVHQAIADVVLANWEALGVRYMAWGGKEWGGSWGGKDRVRPQTTNYGGSDPFHKNHVHVDFYASTKVLTSLPSMKPGTSAPAAPSKAVLAMLADLDYPDVRTAQTDLGLVVDGVAGPITIKALEDEMSKIREDLGKIKTAIERLERQGERNEAIATENQRRITVTREVVKVLGSDSPKIKTAIERIERNTEAGK